MDELEKRLHSLEAFNLAAAPEQAVSITYEVRFFGGAGQIQLRGENLNHTANGDTTFSINQVPGSKVTVVGGTAPASSNGRIEVQVKQGNTILTPFSANVFRGLFVNKLILYIVN